MKEVILGFLGCGNIGGGVYRLLQTMHDELLRRDGLEMRVGRILVKDIGEALAINTS